jgi:hypothetical protein
VFFAGLCPVVAVVVKGFLFRLVRVRLMMSELTEKVFTTTVEKEGSFTFVPIPFSPREAWGSLPRYAVSGTINDVGVRGTLGALAKNYFLRLSTKWLRDSGIQVGTRVIVKLSLEEVRLNSLNKK